MVLAAARITSAGVQNTLLTPKLSRADDARFQVPWEALRALLGQSVYGGRVDSVFDQQLLEGFVASLFQPKCFDLNFPLCRYSRFTPLAVYPEDGGALEGSLVCLK